MSVRRLFVLLFAIALFTMAVRETLDPDMWWHLRTGEAILAGGIPKHDVFSFTVPEHEWVTHEWLSQVLMWLVYQVAGLPGLIVTFAALIALTYWLLYLACAVGLGLRFLHWAWVLYRDSRPHAAINTFKYSIWYLFLLFIALLADHYLMFNL